MLVGLKNLKLSKKRIIIFVLLIAVLIGGISTFLVSNHIRAEKEEAARIESEKRAEEEKIAEEKRLEEEARKKVETEKEKEEENSTNSSSSSTSKTVGNCTTGFKNLMLVNPNFTVSTSWITSRKKELISVSKTYGIKENKSSNGDNLMDKEAAAHLNDMVKAYKAYNSGHTMETRSCFRQVGTTCGRLCAKTGTSDHHTGLTCDLIDPSYGTELNTDLYNKHKEWQWLKANSYKYGFIDRFPEAWAGGSMSEPINVDANGSTGLFETWHYRYVGVTSATEIANGKYNNGKYDSLEHYLKMTKRVSDLKNGKC